jgi:arylsulfatase A-like enzyme
MTRRPLSEKYDNMREVVNPGSRQSMHGLAIAVLFWLVFLLLTGYASVATLWDRVDSTDVMRAASGGVWSGRIAYQVAAFLATLVVLHLVFAALTWALALATSAFMPFARQKFGRMVVGWFSLLAGATLAFNALWYPRTLIGAYYHDALAQRVGPIRLGELIYLAAALLVAYVILRAGILLIRTAPRATRRRLLWVGLSVMAVAVTAAIWPVARPTFASPAEVDRPHIIVLGVDSLRLDQLAQFGGGGVTPHLDEFLASSIVFEDTTTPAARTFSSWTAILTGRAPTVTGARFNLAERSTIKANPTFADVLREHGYRTVYSTDEVRFANIDESFGFDQVVTPQIGAADFLIGTFNEFPLSSLFINTRVGKWLFPFSHANRGVATMFQPRTYLERLEREVSFDEPTLFISHLTAAHWPYYVSDTPFIVPKMLPGEERPLYRVGLQTADTMFGELQSILESKGALRNAIVIVLSDHGEALSLPSDSFFDETFRVEGLRAPLKMLDYGHGQSVLSKSQYQVLLAFRTFGSAPAFGGSARRLDFPATVEDIAPSIVEYAGVQGDPLEATGRSLLPMLAGTDANGDQVPERVRFTETDLAVLPAPGGGVDEDATARQNSKFFEVDPETARLHIREGFAPLAKTFKERAAFTRDHLLAAIPAGPNAHQYIYFDFPRHHGRVLLGRPGDEAPEARMLWDALFGHFQGELKRPVSITPSDWKIIEAEWMQFGS